MPKKTNTPPPSTQTSGSAPTSGRLLDVVVVGVVVLSVVVVVVFGFLLYIDAAYAGKAYKGITIGSVDVSGLNREELLELLEERAAEVERNGITASYGETEVLIESTVASKSEVDTAFPLYAYMLEPTIDEVFAFGRTGNAATNSWSRVTAFISGKRIDAPVDFDQDRFVEILKEEFTDAEVYPQNALLMWEQEHFTASDASSGETFSYSDYAQQVHTQLASLEIPSVTLTLKPTSADILREDVEAHIPTANTTYDAAPFAFTWEDKTWELTKEVVAASLVVERRDGSVVLGYSVSGMEPLLQDIRNMTDIEAHDARFQIVDGKVAEFQNSQEGRSLDIDALFDALRNMIQEASYDAPIALSVKTVAPEVTESDAEHLGITELVAKGTTNFAGSPTNRRKNIANGVRLINGTLIKPGETFSTVKALSPIEISNGFFSELVIKGNRTIPEVGGGLCQVSTTLFRSALNAGLPIVERKNHSYRVSYYEPPVGMDATIYDPAPDFKFTNDYDSYLLLLGYVVGNDITFELWGTKDGRVAETSTPRMYNITSPGPTKYIETDELAPGQQNCIERAHNGASADFTYTVTYPDGEKKEEIFYSKYKAWQAVCLVGV